MSSLSLCERHKQNSFYRRWIGAEAETAESDISKPRHFGNLGELTHEE